jgi:hypothetical protein
MRGGGVMRGGGGDVTRGDANVETLGDPYRGRPPYPVFPITKSEIFPTTVIKRTLQTDTNISLSQQTETT